MGLITSLSLTELTQYVSKQLDSFFPDGSVDGSDLNSCVEESLSRLAVSFSSIRLKYYYDGENALFNHLHTDQYAAFLYFLSNTAHRHELTALASKAYALNKALHGVDIFYEVQLPDIFLLQHPVGTVLGRGTYSNYLVVYQRCSVGANLDNCYPRLGEGVVLFGGSTVIGRAVVQENSWLSVNSVVMDEAIPPNSVVFGRSPTLVVKRTRRNVVQHFFHRLTS